MHNVAGIDEAETNTAADRRGDAGISELEFSVVDLALIRLDGPIKLANECSLRVKLLLGNDAFLEKKIASAVIYFIVSALRLGLGEIPHRLFMLDLQGTRHDPMNDHPAEDELTFLERNTDE